MNSKGIEKNRKYKLRSNFTEILCRNWTTQNRVDKRAGTTRSRYLSLWPWIIGPAAENGVQNLPCTSVEGNVVAFSLMFTKGAAAVLFS